LIAGWVVHSILLPTLGRGGGGGARVPHTLRAWPGTTGPGPTGTGVGAVAVHVLAAVSENPAEQAAQPTTSRQVAQCAGQAAQMVLMKPGKMMVAVVAPHADLAPAAHSARRTGARSNNGKCPRVGRERAVEVACRKEEGHHGQPCWAPAPLQKCQGHSQGGNLHWFRMGSLLMSRQRTT
jgi:hypothetical protein